MRELKVLGWFGIAILVGACSAAGGENAAENASESTSTLATAFKNDETAYLYFLGKGLTNFQSAAIVGNLDQESGVDPTISQSGGGVGRGIAQWSTGGRWDTAQGDNLKDFAAQEGKPMTDLGVQLDFIWFELTTFPDDYGLPKLKASTNVTDATQVVEDNFEGCVYANYPECELPNRVKFAMAVLDAYGNESVPGSGGSGGASSGGATSAGGAGGSATSSAGAGGVTSSAGASGGGATSATSGGTSSNGGAVSSSAGASSSSAGAASVAGGTSTSSSAGASSSTPTNGASESSSCAFVETGLAKSHDRGLGLAGVLLGLIAFARGNSRKNRRSAHKK